MTARYKYRAADVALLAATFCRRAGAFTVSTHLVRMAVRIFDAALKHDATAQAAAK